MVGLEMHFVMDILKKVVILQNKLVTQQAYDRTRAHDKSVCDNNSMIVLIYKHPSFNTTYLQSFDPLASTISGSIDVG